MANTLTNFLVGIGYDYDTKGQKQVESGIDGIKSKALQLGTVVAGAFGLKSLTSDFASVNDSIGKFSNVMGVSANNVTAIGRALEMNGGSMSSFMNQLSSLEKMRAGLLVGDAGFEAAAGASGIDTNVIKNAASATEAYVGLADQFSKLSRQQRLNAASALGLDESSIRLLSKGGDEVRRLVQAQKDLRPTTEAMTVESAAFNDNMQTLTDGVGAFADSISLKLMPQINNVLKGMNDWIKVNKEFIQSGIDKTFGAIGDNAGLIAPSLGLLGGAVTAKTLASGANMVGAAGTAGTLTKGSRLLARLGVKGAVIGGGIAALGATKEGIADTTGVELPDFLFTPISDFFPSLSMDDIASGVTSTRFGQSSSRGGKVKVDVSVKSDSAMFKAEVVKVSETLNNEALENLATSGGG